MKGWSPQYPSTLNAINFQTSSLNAINLKTNLHPLIFCPKIENFRHVCKWLKSFEQEFLTRIFWLSKSEMSQIALVIFQKLFSFEAKVIDHHIFPWGCTQSKTSKWFAYKLPIFPAQDF